MSRTAGSSKRSLKQEMDNSDDDEDLPPPLLEAEGVTTKDESPDEEAESDIGNIGGSLSDVLFGDKTLNDLMSEQFESATKKETGKETQSPTVRLTRSRINPATTLASTPTHTSPFMSVVGKNLLSYADRNARSAETVFSLRGLQRARKEPSPVPMKKARTATLRYPHSMSSPMNIANDTIIQNLLKTKKPIQVDVAVGNGAGSSSSFDKEADESPESPPCTSSSTDLQEIFSSALTKRVFPQKIINNSTDHGILLGLMVMNAHNSLGVRGSASQSSFSQDVYKLFQKHNVS